MNKDIDYTLKRSSRAKHVAFRMSMRRGLIITVPTRFNIKKLPRYIEQKRQWIEYQSEKLRLRKQEIGGDETQGLPTTVSLHAVGASYQVEYRQTTATTVKCLQDDAMLIVYGKIKDEKLCAQALGKWLQQEAKTQLGKWFERYSQEMQLPYVGLTIRGQSSRWGSCSARKSISLNKKLLFLPPDLVEYIFLHELCHTVHMNHSSKFWQLVEQYDADYRQKDKQTKRSAWYAYIPVWAD